MNRHVLAALLLVVLLILMTPVLLIQSSGVANASLTSGFMLPLDNKLHCFLLVITGCFAAWLGREMLVLLPLCGLIMLALGALSHLDSTVFSAVQGYSAGAILLFAFSISVMRHKTSMLSVIPVALWGYFTGGTYFLDLPSGIQPIFYLIGAVMSAALLMAIGVALAITLAEILRPLLYRLSKVSAVASLLSLF